MSFQNSYSDHELLQQLAVGNERAFKILFDIYHRRLFNYISRFVKSDQVAEELVMDVFMKIWMGKELVTQISNFDAFLFRIAHNKAIDFLRSASTNLQLKELLWEKIQISTTEYADSRILVKEFEDKIREAISLLSPQRNKVYCLSREQDLSHDKIASQLYISKATVNNHIVEAQKFIRNYLLANFDLAIMLVFANMI